MESAVFQTVPLDSTWSLHRLLMDSTWSPWRLLGTSRKCGMESSWTLHGVSVESPWSPHGVHGDSLWTPQSLRGLHGNPWVSVKYSLNLRTILAQRFVSWEGLIQVVAVCPPYTYDGHMLSVFSPLATLKKSSSPFTSKCAPRAHHQPSHSASAADTPPYPHSNDNIAIIETDTTPQSTLLSINPNPPTTLVRQILTTVQP